MTLDVPVILVVDDDASVRSLVMLHLASRHFTVLEASSGQEALELIRSRSIDLVIADVYMPGMDGIELEVRVSNEVPGLKIVMISGGGDIGKVDVLEVATRLGAVATIEKPFSGEQLRKVVGEALGKGVESWPDPTSPVREPPLRLIK